MVKAKDHTLSVLGSGRVARLDAWSEFVHGEGPDGEAFLLFLQFITARNRLVALGMLEPEQHILPTDAGQRVLDRAHGYALYRTQQEAPAHAE